MNYFLLNEVRFCLIFIFFPGHFSYIWRIIKKIIKLFLKRCHEVMGRLVRMWLAQPGYDSNDKKGNGPGNEDGYDSGLLPPAYYHLYKTLY